MHCVNHYRYITLITNELGFSVWMPLISPAVPYFSKCAPAMVHSFLSTSLRRSSPVQHKDSQLLKKKRCGCYHGIKSNDYLLRGKKFILETDHSNLVWIKKSEVPKIIRWGVYMQSFNFLIRHICGSLNTIADYLSRMHTNPSTRHLNAIDERGGSGGWAYVHDICRFTT